MSSNITRFGGHITSDDWHKSRRECILNDKPDANNPRGGHHFGGIWNEVDYILKQNLQKAVYLMTHLLGKIGNSYASLSYNLQR